jgi:L-lactate dehydrogenase (cytochrome)
MGAMGGPGVTLALNILRKELEVTLALTGCTDIRAADASILRRPNQNAQSGASLRHFP